MLAVEKLPALIPPTVPYDYSLNGGTVHLPVKEGLKIPLIIPSLRMVDEMFSGEKGSIREIFARGFDEPGDSFEFNPNKKVKFTVGVNSQELFTQNVVATLEGSDPHLKNEYIVIGAARATRSHHLVGV